MIKVTLELIPFGDISKIQTIGIAAIANDGSGNLEVGNYNYVVGTIFAGETTEKIMGRLEEFKRDDGAWKLLYEVLKKKYAE